MTAQRAAGGVLDRTEAELLTLQLQQALDLAVELVDRAVTGRVWIALGYKTWGDYCAARLPRLAELIARATVDERVGVVVALRREGVSLRGIAAPLGISASQAALDAKAGGAPKLARVLGLDGREIAAPTSAPRAKQAPRPLVDRIVELLAGEPAGLDVREITRRLRVERTRVAPALCRLDQAGRITYQRPARRGQLGRYGSPVTE